jgi:Trypsin-like peptidase domain
MEKSLVEIRGTVAPHAFVSKPMQCDSYSCTGFCITHESKKYILTNSHCVGNSLHIHSIDGDRYKTKIVFQCKLCDLALLESEICDKLIPLEFEYIIPDIGEFVHLYSVHNDNINKTSGTCRTIHVPKSPLNKKLSLFIDAQILAGDSGGPVLNNKGKIVGVIFYGHDEDEYSGYALAYPAIQNFFDRYVYFLESGKTFTTVNLLVRFQTLYHREQLQKYYGLKGTGVMITKSKIVNNDIFKKLEVNDILVKINDIVVKNNGMISCKHIYKTNDKNYNIPFTTYISYFIPGQKYTLTVLRNSQTITLDFVAEEAYFPRDIYSSDFSFNWCGMTFLPLSMELMYSLYEDGIINKAYVHLLDNMIENTDFGDKVKLVMLIVQHYYIALDVNEWVSFSIVKSVNNVLVKDAHHLKEILSNDITKLTFYNTANQLVIDPKKI